MEREQRDGVAPERVLRQAEPCSWPAIPPRRRPVCWLVRVTRPHLEYSPDCISLLAEINFQKNVRGWSRSNCTCWRYGPNQVFCARQCPVRAADRVIRWTTAGLWLALRRSFSSSEDACALVRAHGEAGWTGRLVPLTVDGLDLCEFEA